MSEVAVVATFTVKPEQEEEALAGLRTLVERSNEEEGCLQYALHRPRDRPGELVIVERWRSQEDLDAHFRMPYMAELGPLAEKVLAAPPEIRFCDPA